MDDQNIFPPTPNPILMVNLGVDEPNAASPFDAVPKIADPATVGSPFDTDMQKKAKLKRTFALAVIGLVMLILIAAILFGGGGDKPAAPSAPAPALSVAPADDVAAPVSPVPASPAATVAAPAQPPVATALDACEQNMTDYAVQNGADAKAYIAQNQAYLVECRKALAAQTNPTSVMP